MPGGRTANKSPRGKQRQHLADYQTADHADTYGRRSSAPTPVLNISGNAPSEPPE